MPCKNSTNLMWATCSHFLLLICLISVKPCQIARPTVERNTCVVSVKNIILKKFQLLSNSKWPTCGPFNMRNTVDLLFFACSNFREFLILGLFSKFRIREFSFFFSSAIIIIIFAIFLNSRICPLREIREN